MTEILADMGSSMKKTAQEFKDPVLADQATIAQLVKAARARGDDLTGPNGLLKQLTKTVLETALLTGSWRSTSVTRSTTSLVMAAGTRGTGLALRRC